MKLLTLLYVFCLFYVFIPGNVFKLPIKTSKMNIILIHALLFSVILSCTYSLVENVRVLEGMSGAHEHDKHEHDEYVKKTDSKKPVEEKKKPGEQPKEPLPQQQMMGKIQKMEERPQQQVMMENKERPQQPVMMENKKLNA